jgi:putative salt-induced outer membrane protein YdiY
LEFGGVRASSRATTRTAVGTLADFTLVEVERSETTAESYFARGRYDREFGAGFGFTGAGWDRNTFSGIQNRFQIVAGLGRSFVDGEASRFKADVGLTYTVQKDVDPAPDADEAFGGWRLSVDAMRVVSPNAQVNSELVLNNSFADVDDVRADWINSLSVSINSSLTPSSKLDSVVTLTLVIKL